MAKALSSKLSCLQLADIERGKHSMQITLSSTLMLASSYLAATTKMEEHSLKAWALVGAVLGGWLGNIVANESNISFRERNVRWVANAITAFLFALPFARIFAKKFDLDVNSEIVIASGGITGVFGVALLVTIMMVLKRLAPALPDWINYIINKIIKKPNDKE